MKTEQGARYILLRGGVGSIVAKVLSTLSAFGLAVVLARELGAEGYGVYAYVLALVSVVAIPAQFGLPQLVVRETATAHATESWSLMRGVWRWTNLVAGALSVISACAVGAFAWLFQGDFTTVQLDTLSWGLMLVPMIALGKLRGAALRGLRRVVAGQVPESILRPVLLMVLVVTASFVVPSSRLSAPDAMALHSCAAFLAFIVGAMLLRQSRPSAIQEKVPPVYESRAWIKATLPLALLAGMQLIIKYTDILLLGAFSTSDDVGIYSVVVQGATLVGFGHQAVNAVMAPLIARLHIQNSSETLQDVIAVGARVSLLLALPVALVFFVWGDVVLGVFFGPEYARGYTALAILSCGHVANAAMGHVAHLLNMTGHELTTARGMGLAAIGNVLLNLILIPVLGISGAALATALTLVFWNTMLWRAAWHRLQVKNNVFTWGQGGNAKSVDEG